MTLASTSPTNAMSLTTILSHLLLQTTPRHGGNGVRSLPLRPHRLAASRRTVPRAKHHLRFEHALLHVLRYAMCARPSRFAHIPVHPPRAPAKLTASPSFPRISGGVQIAARHEGQIQPHRRALFGLAHLVPLPFLYSMPRIL